MLEFIVAGIATAAAAAIAKASWDDTRKGGAAHQGKGILNTDDLERLRNEGWGLAQVSWDKGGWPDYAGIARSYGPIDFAVDYLGQRIVFEYVVFGHLEHAHLRHKSGGDNLTFEQAQACCNGAQILAGKNLGLDTRAKVIAWRAREANIRQETAALARSADEHAERLREDIKAKGDAVRRAHGDGARAEALADMAQFVDSRIRVVKALSTNSRPERVQAVDEAVRRMNVAHEYLVKDLEFEAREAKAAAERKRREDEQAAHQRRISAEIQLRESMELQKKQRLAAGIALPADAGAGIIIGTDVNSGEDVALPLKKMPHAIVAGASGSGKSVFLHQLVYQLVRHPEVERVYLVDLKGGVEFGRYASSANVELVSEFEGVQRVLHDLVELMSERQRIMLANKWQNWPNKRIYVVIDEYAELQNDIDDAKGQKDAKQAAQTMERNLVRLARRARALGIVLVCAMQKATRDAIDSAVKGNLALRLSFRAPSREAAAALLDDWEDAPVDPRDCRTGRFLYFDASRGGKVRYLQTHIAPGVEL